MTRHADERSYVRFRAKYCHVELSLTSGASIFGVLVNVGLGGACVDCDPDLKGTVSIQIHRQAGKPISRKGVFRNKRVKDGLCHIEFDNPLDESQAASLIVEEPIRSRHEQFVKELAQNDLKAVLAEIEEGHSRISTTLFASIAASAAVIAAAVAFAQKAFPGKDGHVVAFSTLLGGIPVIVGVLALLVVIRQMNRTSGFAGALSWRIAKDRVPTSYRGWAFLRGSLCDCVRKEWCPENAEIESCFELADGPAHRNCRKSHFLDPLSIMNHFPLCAALALLVMVAGSTVTGVAALLWLQVSPLSVSAALMVIALIGFLTILVAQTHRGRYSYEKYYYAWLHAVDCRALPTIPDSAEPC